ncbi:MAG: sugar phosphate isomerase/epimerase [Bacilli bacterium]|nr:sugar phosphate isomerase/epimerase [Bacilli bacterium]
MNKRYVVVDTGGLSKLKDTYEALDYIKEAGYEAFDLTIFWESARDSLGVVSNYQELVKRFKEYMDKLGLVCRQTHAYFTSGISPELIEKRFKIISQDIKVSKLVGAKICVIHPIWELSLDENVKFIKRFIPLIHELDIKLAIENVWGVKDNKPSIMCSSTASNLKELLDKLNDDHIGACVDIGHAEMGNLNTSASSIIKTLKDKVFTLHIHDNDKYSDLHQLPYSGSIDFTSVLDALKEINYQGDIVFEVSHCYMNMPKELYPATLSYLKKIGDYFLNYLNLSIV